jgi:enoyl-CoA hydratase
VSELIVVERPRSGVALVTLNRPEKLNAMNHEMFLRLAQLWVELDEDQDVRCIVLTGAGRGFSAGHDLEETAGAGAVTIVDRIARLDEEVASLTALRDISKPVIAAINGPAVGGGFSVAMLADIRVASSTSMMAVAFIGLGLSSGDAGLSWTLPRVVGLGVASDLMFTGRSIDADEALRLGIVNRVVNGADLLSTSLDIAEQIAQHLPLALRLTKEALTVNIDASFADAVRFENRTQLIALTTPEAHAAEAAFVAKRAKRQS